MNNKGQALVLFILLLPIILIALAFVVDIGLLNSTKKSTDQKLEQVIENNLKNNLLEQEIDELLILNFDNINYKNIVKKDNQIEITIEINLQTIFPNIMSQKKYKVTYIGYLENERIRTVRK